MCSIVGARWLEGRPAPPLASIGGSVATALDVLRSRGPDEADAIVLSDRCVMGGNRLAIRPIPGASAVPLRRGADRAFYNGEIYNYRRWVSNSQYDGDAILAAYEEHGLECFREFEGEFAISIWDERDATVVLARDPFGAKPLYFSFDGHRLLWASSAAAIHRMEPHSFCAAATSPVQHLTHMPQEPYTSYSGVWLLPPGHLLVASAHDVEMYAYHQWQDVPADSQDTRETFEALEHSLRQRMDYQGTLGIPMSGGIDSGIIAFMADALGVQYHVFSVVEMDGEATPETAIIEERLKRLRQPNRVTRLACNRREYDRALEDLYLPDYYSCENFDSGAILTHTVYSAMRAAGVHVALDGSGGDELFHGYPFRDAFGPPDGWPHSWTHVPYYYSIVTSLLSWTAKSDRAGGHFSIESRFPFLSVPLMRAAMRLRPNAVLKWPLRRFLLEKLEYGPPMPADLGAKFGFSLPPRQHAKAIADMQRCWCERNQLTTLPTATPKRFPFAIGNACASRRIG